MTEKTAHPGAPPPYSPNNPPPGYSAPGDYPGAGPNQIGRQQPPAGGYPFPGGLNQPPTVILGAPGPGGGPATVVTVVNAAQWGPFPMHIICPHCSARVMTETTTSPGLLTWLLSGALVFLGCWIGCCLIPCCIPECQDVEHRCPNCKVHLGSFRRM